MSEKHHTSAVLQQLAGRIQAAHVHLQGCSIGAVVACLDLRNEGLAQLGLASV